MKSPPPGASAAAMTARSRAAFCQKKFTRMAKILSKRAPPRSASAKTARRKAALPAATCAALRCSAALIAAAERSMARIVPLSSRSQTSAAATPRPQPISSSRSPGPKLRVATAQAINGGIVSDIRTGRQSPAHHPCGAEAEHEENPERWPLEPQRAVIGQQVDGEEEGDEHAHERKGAAQAPPGEPRGSARDGISSRCGGRGAQPDIRR